MDRRVGCVEAGPAGGRVEVLIDEPVVESGECHAFRAPLPESDAVAPAVTAEANRSSRRGRRTGRPVRGTGPAECGQRRLRLVVVERCLQRAALSLQSRQPDQRLAALIVEVAVVAGDGSHLTGDRVGPRLESIEQWREVRPSLG